MGFAFIPSLHWNDYPFAFCQISTPAPRGCCYIFWSVPLFGLFSSYARGHERGLKRNRVLNMRLFQTLPLARSSPFAPKSACHSNESMFNGWAIGTKGRFIRAVERRFRAAEPLNGASEWTAHVAEKGDFAHTNSEKAVAKSNFAAAILGFADEKVEFATAEAGFANEKPNLAEGKPELAKGIMGFAKGNLGLAKGDLSFPLGNLGFPKGYWAFPFGKSRSARPGGVDLGSFLHVR